ncbi:hypothetical protein BCR34DRAFT_611704 [Clohesyomyces aquaticus]|uniref:DUF6603 domain-containing protein n=1 Tax=Clohesyomyces aquaticus TaxID=1231657 RepID=A0A1Y2A1C6_9PLEO|nr:hypothetical protein BCR34DRAFT_611704 [Clohesyomyces aquaticus]
MDPTPKSFINSDQVVNHAIWNAIVTQSPLGLTVITAASPIVLRSQKLWGGMLFSSSENLTRFGPVNDIDGNASTANKSRDAVFGLKHPLQVPQPGFFLASIISMFDIQQRDLSADFDSLVRLIDANGPVQLSLDNAEHARNALWMLAGPNYGSAVNVVFKIPEIATLAITNFVRQTFGLAVQPISSPAPFRLSIRWTTSYRPNVSNPNNIDSISEYRITLDIPIDGFEMSFVFTRLGVALRIANPPDWTRSDVPLFTRLNGALLRQNPSPAIGSTDLLDSGPFSSMFSHFDLWYISLARSVRRSETANVNGDFNVPEFGALEWQINVIADWNSSNGVVVALRYDSNTSSFAGRLLFSSDDAPAYAHRQYNYDRHTDIRSATTKPLPEPINIWGLLGVKDSAPHQIPHLVTAANLALSKIPDGFNLSLQSTILSSSAASTQPNTVAKKEAPHGFSWDAISLSALISHVGSQPPSLSARVSTQMSLYPRRGSTLKPATFMVDVSYKTGGAWILNGQAFDLKFALLYNYLPSSAQDFALKVLGDLELKYLNVFYTFHPTRDGVSSSGSASSFFIAATIAFGDLELALNYEYASTQLPDSEDPASQIFRAQRGIKPSKSPLKPKDNQDQWTFSAILSANSKNTRLGDIIKALTGKSLLPDFIYGIDVHAGPGGNAAVMFILRGNDDYTILTLALSLGDISVTLVFLSPSGSSGDSPKSKTILRVSLDQIPIVETAPLIKVLPMPFDKLLYLYLDDDGPGLVKQELDAINDELAYLSIGRIDYKEITKDTSMPAIRAGHHFMVVDKGTVILDHCFSDANGKPPPEQPTPNPGSTEGGAKEEAPPAKGALEKKLPLLSISALSLMFRSGVLGFEFDATVTLGSFIDFSLIDFSIGVDLASIKDLKSAIPKPDLQGLGLSLNAPPVKLAGVFVREKIQGKDSYRGGVSLAFQTWNFLAVGEYAVISHSDGDFKAMFVYAKLMGPLMTIGFATISGVRIGLGYNSAVRSPSIGDLPKFPFLVDSVDANGGNKPLKIVESMMTSTPSGPPWVAPKRNAYWVAAGLTLTAFGILSVTAVLMLQMQEQGYIISVFANGKAQLPCNVSPNATLFYVEIGMISEINTVEGYFTVQAALAPASHILVPNCRLTGGFALVNWFHPSVHSGDFVFTVGGYHRAYKPPEWYPAVERIGIAFTLGGMINVTGGVYFAITPKCVMGGGALHMGLDVGPVSAWLDISLDVFIQFKPFHYTADLQVSVGCAISIKVWFIHVRIKASVGALLHIEGPDPFGGYANVDFYLFSFTIHFGGNAKPPDPAKLDEFYQMVHQPGPESSPTAAPEGPPVDPMLAQLKFTLESGLFPQYQAPPADNVSPSGPFQDSGSSSGWIVKPGDFHFSITCDFALTTAKLRVTDVTGGPSFIDILTADSSSAPAFGSKPMHISTDPSDHGPSDPNPPNKISSHLDLTIKNLDTGEIINGFTAEFITRPLPRALWGSYKGDDDPARHPSPTALRTAENPTIDLAVGVKVSRPENPANLVFSGIQSFDPTIALRTALGPFELERSGLVDERFLAAQPQGSGVPDEGAWNEFGHDWVAAHSVAEELVGNDEADDGMLKMAAEWLGWNMNQPAASAAPVGGQPPNWVLDGKLPKGLLSTLGTEYPVLPRECGVIS